MVSSNVFDRALTNRIDNVRDKIDVFHTVFANSSQKLEERVAAAVSLKSAAQDVLDILEERDRPPWVLPILNAARHFAASRTTASAKALLREIIRFDSGIKPLKSSGDSSSVSFDQVFQRLIREGNIPELFQKLIEQTEVLINSGEIESVTVLTALRRLLDVARANKDGSFVAISQTSFLARFIKNAGIEYLKSIPGIGPAVVGWEKTISDIEDERKELERKLEHESRLAVLDENILMRIEMIPAQVPFLLSSQEAPSTKAPLLLGNANATHPDASLSDDLDTTSQSD